MREFNLYLPDLSLENISLNKRKKTTSAKKKLTICSEEDLFLPRYLQRFGLRSYETPIL